MVYLDLLGTLFSHEENFLLLFYVYLGTSFAFIMCYFKKLKLPPSMGSLAMTELEFHLLTDDKFA